MSPVSNEELDKRVTYLEFKVDEHDDLTQEMNATLTKIDKTILQVKWAVFGAVALYIYQAIGIHEAIKLIF